MALGARLIEALGGPPCRTPRKCRGWETQCAAVYYLLGKAKLCKADCGIAALPKSAMCGEEVRPDIPLPEEPKIYIDLGLWDIHTEAEKNELVEQVVASIAVVRRHLFDSNLVLARTPAEFLEKFNKMAKGMRHAAAISREPPPPTAVVLDPEGPLSLTEDVVRAEPAFIVGGVVDKERIYKGATSRLAASIGASKRYRIELRGSTVGVPDRINKVIEILLAVRFGASLEEAIIAAQAKRDKLYRLIAELQRMAKGGKAPRAPAEAVARWLRAEGLLEMAAKKAHIALE
nr:MAG: tRNA (guanine-N1)-methyltransferase [Thermoproteus sp. AZ2]